MSTETAASPDDVPNREEIRARILAFLLDRVNGAMVWEIAGQVPMDVEPDDLSALLAEMVEEGVIRPAGYEVTDRTRHAAECCSCVV